jgi:methylthioxylose transferase
VVTVLAATTAVAVLVTLRTLGAELMARRAAPFLVLTPAAVFMAVSADAVFAAIAAWGLACLALGAVSVSRGRLVAWSVLAGLLLGAGVMMSYGLPLVGLLAIAVLVLARSWLPLPVAAVAALAVVLAFAVGGFSWWEAYPVLNDRYWDGIAADRPAAYWMWGNLAALVVCAGPLLGAGLAQLVALRGRADRVVLWLVSAAVAAIVAADLSRMSKAEVERIWLPFVPWLMVSTALLPERWRRVGVAVQVVSALLVQQLLYTSW